MHGFQIFSQFNRLPLHFVDCFFCCAETLFWHGLTCLFLPCCCAFGVISREHGRGRTGGLGDLVGVTRGLLGHTWWGARTPSGDPGSPPSPLGWLHWGWDTCPWAALPLCARRAWQEGGAGGGQVRVPGTHLHHTSPNQAPPQPGWGLALEQRDPCWPPWARPAPSVTQIGRLHQSKLSWAPRPRMPALLPWLIGCIGPLCWVTNHLAA